MSSICFLKLNHTVLSLSLHCLYFWLNLKAILFVLSFHCRLFSSMNTEESINHVSPYPNVDWFEELLIEFIKVNGKFVTVLSYGSKDHLLPGVGMCR